MSPSREVRRAAEAAAEKTREQLRFLEIISGGHPAIVRARREVEESLAYMLHGLGGSSGGEVAA